MELWSLKCKIQLRVWELMKNVSDKFFGSWEVVSDSGDMLVCNHFHQLLFHYDSKGKLVDKFEEDFVTPSVLRLSFKESLVRHEFFERKVRKLCEAAMFFPRDVMVSILTLLPIKRGTEGSSWRWGFWGCKQNVAVLVSDCLF